MTYPLTFYVDSLPAGVGGCANGPVIRILKKYRGDIGILKHEIEHVRQWWVLTVLTAPVFYLIDPMLTGLCMAAHPALYLAVRQYRLWCEVRAYRIQMRHPDKNGAYLSASGAARRLAVPRYRLNLSVEQALAEFV